jgi:hypothetical protein
MSSSKTIALLAALIIIGALVGYLAWANYQEDIARIFHFKRQLFSAARAVFSSALSSL